MITYFDAVHALVGGQLIGPSNGPLSEINFIDGQVPPSEQVIQAKIAELTAAEPLRLLREQRNQLLAQSDWMANSDVTMSEEWRVYRQALRDLPNTQTPTLDENGQLTNITWPEKPQ
jgi:hypothetical protein